MQALRVAYGVDTRTIKVEATTNLQSDSDTMSAVSDISDRIGCLVPSSSSSDNNYVRFGLFEFVTQSTSASYDGREGPSHSERDAMAMVRCYDATLKSAMAMGRCYDAMLKSAMAMERCYDANMYVRFLASHRSIAPPPPRV